MTNKRIVFALALAALTAACAPEHKQAAIDPKQKEVMDTYRRPKDIPFDKENPYSREKADLGRALFFDARLGHENAVSCATCHVPGLGWGDGLVKSPATLGRTMPRHSSTLANLAWDELYFWDGRVDSLEAQMLAAVAGPGMNTPHAELEKKLKAIPGYAPLFAKAFPGGGEAITAANVSKAIAVYERTIVSGRSPFDAWIEGDEAAISDDAKQGFWVFNGKAHCAACHSSWRFTDGSFHDIGLPGEDPGRGRALKTIVKMQHAFKTPSLRDVTLSAPYFHDGSGGTLIDVVNHYDKGGIQRDSLSVEMKALGLSNVEKRQLLAFLATLTATGEPTRVPALP
ncbi:MAG: tryptophan tryptophylquinone biosynthesis enzyme MauG [Alphaproteobacteria bacterium]|nr:tryptophan tryptophylquinone biosynthesis enzyme MauG [Alphaproteobacteria bacterium]